mmetsp:Transcript_49877/g.53823  ORF Transcript_49877/g.53823 Transcript_49877/m.53823 type:complete len:312 (+) Transcript_49877:96-1031(+)
MISETVTPLVPSEDLPRETKPKPITIGFNLDLLKAFGMLMGSVMLVAGLAITKAKIFPGDGSYGNRHEFPKLIEETYIRQMFHMSHTCLFIDFTPARDVAALLISFFTLPLMIFTYVNHRRIEEDKRKDPVEWYSLYLFSKYTWLFRVLCLGFFFMVFVNSPDGVYKDPNSMSVSELIADDGWWKFQKHYFFYFLYQISMALLAIESSWQHYKKNDHPFLTRKFLWYYNLVTFVWLAYYTLWIVTFQFGLPFPGHTNENDAIGFSSWRWVWANFIMLGYDVLTVIAPGIVALWYSQHYPEKMVISFELKQD